MWYNVIRNYNKEESYILELIDLKSSLISDNINTLLKDRTTNKNIIFATNDYEGFSFSDEITNTIIENENVDFRPRVQKSLEEQNIRTKNKAEVFTPSWICNKMNNFLDEEWFGQKNVFNTESKDKKWTSTYDKKIEFDNKDDWKKYVLSKRMEITCGEAPFLVSRYDTATGGMIPIEDRIGLLDRKLRIVSENTGTVREWNKWAYRAYESTFGYEFQGDSLLIARINLLETFYEYYVYKWKKKPNETSVKRIADIISRNIWQMDGIHEVLPYPGGFIEDGFSGDPNQINFFDKMVNTEQKQDEAKEIETIDCKIFDWKEKEEVLFKQIKECEDMKFDYIIGNPPFDDADKKSTNKYKRPLYDDFLLGAFKTGEKVMTIHPARCLFNAGMTSKKFNDTLLSDEHINVLYYTPDAKVVFPEIGFKGGVTITYRDNNKIIGPIGHFVPDEMLRSILYKTKLIPNFESLTNIIHVQSKFNLKVLYDRHPEFRGLIDENCKEKRLISPIFERLDIFKDEKENDDSIGIWGIIDSNVRVMKYVDRSFLINKDGMLDAYKVILPASNGSGAIGEVLSTPLIGEPLIGEPLIGYTQSFIGIGKYDNIEHAKALLKYIKSKYCRVMLGILKVTPNNFKKYWRYVPLQDFTSDSDIDWTKSVHEIDMQLYKKYNLSEEEIDFIEKNVKEME